MQVFCEMVIQGSVHLPSIQHEADSAEDQVDAIGCLGSESHSDEEVTRETVETDSSGETWAGLVSRELTTGNCEVKAARARIRRGEDKMIPVVGVFLEGSQWGL